MSEPKIPTLTISVALATFGCAAKDCMRVILPGEAYVLRKSNDIPFSAPLCPVHAAEAVEDVKLAARMFLHSEEQRVMTEKILAGEEPPPATLPQGR